jgi:PKD repeat protein
MPLTHAQLRTTEHKRWTARATIDGRTEQLVVGLPTRTLSRLRPRNSARLEVRDIPAAPGLPAYVDLVLEDVGSVRFFTGNTTQRSAQSSTLGRLANLIDFLPLDQALPSAITWNARPWPDAVRDVLVAGGVAAESIDSVYDPGADFTIAPVYPVTVTTKEAVGRVLQELLEFGGAAVISTPTGRVRVIADPGIPAGDSQVVYARATADTPVNLATEFGIFDAALSIEGDEDVISTFTATGPRRPDGAIPDGTFTAASVRGRADSRQYRHAQTDAVCQKIAKREVERRAREATTITIECGLNPLIEQGDTILFRDPTLGYDLNTPAIVEEAATTADGAMRLTVSLGPSLVLGYGSSIEPPVVDFAYQVEQQLINLAGAGLAQRVQVQFQDQSRDRQGYAITARSWTFAGPGVTPASSSEPSPVVSFTSLAGATATLTVTSASGESATLTRTIQAPETQTLTRVVAAAAGSDGWRVLNGPDGWRAYSVSGAACTAVPSINDRGGGLLAGFANGAIYRSYDGLRTAPTLVTTLAGSIGALWVNEADPLNLVAGHGTKLSRSLDGGASWTLLADLAETVRDVQSSPGNASEIRVCAGNKLYRTFNAINFAAAITGAAGSEARAVATAPWGRGVAFAGSGLALADAIHFEDGAAVDWGGVDPAERPANGLTALTPLLSTAGFLAAEGSVGDLVRDGTLDSLAYYAASGAGGRVYTLAWTGSQYAAALAGTAPGAGAGKILNGATPASAFIAPVDDVGAAQVAYGSLSAPPPSAEILIGTWGASPGGIYHRRPEGWVLRNSGLPAGWFWRQVLALATAPDTWLALGNSSSGGQYGSSGGNVQATDGSASPLWITTDAGASWSPVTLNSPGVNVQVAGVPALVSHPTAAGWALTLVNGGSTNSYLWRPDGTVMDLRTGAGVSGGTSLTAPAIALDRDGTTIAIMAQTGGTGRLRWVEPGATSVTTPAFATNRTPTPSVGVARLYGGSGRGLLVRTFFPSTTLYVTPDYRTTDLSPITLSGAAAAAPVPYAVTGRAYVLRAGEVWQLDGLLGGAPTATAVYTTSAIEALVADKQRGLVLCGKVSGGTGFVIFRDGAWESIAGPGVSSTLLSGGSVEIISR